MTSSPDQLLPIVDLHSHLVPGVDDGAATITESLAALAGLYQEGVRTVVTTPHLLIPHLESHAAISRELDVHRRAFDRLAEAVAGREDLPALALGQEIYAPDASAARRVARRTDSCWSNSASSCRGATSMSSARSSTRGARSSSHTRSAMPICPVTIHWS